MTDKGIKTDEPYDITCNYEREKKVANKTYNTKNMDCKHALIQVTKGIRSKEELLPTYLQDILKATVSC